MLKLASVCVSSPKPVLEGPIKLQESFKSRLELAIQRLFSVETSGSLHSAADQYDNISRSSERGRAVATKRSPELREALDRGTAAQEILDGSDELQQPARKEERELQGSVVKISSNKMRQGALSGRERQQFSNWKKLGQVEEQ
ncbi:hypothetical protein CDL15_Pgr009211 [Punica granatum]|uniref:Uncharacterized protein n=1 Tax=Punica granatum TaxID=22663 RepID=A0A218WVL9_PUNGR|nr:hypothetical protein CDL15_Pgr009211 [Punica granatum]PKI48581.1 hypothetical protein CRG98_031000 [Punica granatum]